MITIIDYGMGNLGSIANMLKKIGHPSEITSDRDKIESASKLILPGVGSFDKAMKNLKELDLIDIINKAALDQQKPFLGICLGMQLMCSGSEEGKQSGLGLIDAKVKRFNFNSGPKHKIPHMGWNLIAPQKQHSLLKDLDTEPRFYFVHSYHVVCNNEEDVLTITDYGYDFVSAFAHNNVMGVQFHPEKSHKFGMRLLKNFIENV